MNTPMLGMKSPLCRWTIGLLFASAALTASCDLRNLGPQRRITILATNDIHGSVEAARVRGAAQGGMAHFAGVVAATREGLRKRHGKSAGVLVLDGGDQFQGTLLSNYSEGSLVIDLMNSVGYDAAVPGNHDYDFGPKGWLDDQVTPTNPDRNPRSVIEGLARTARFPLVSANTYFLDSLVDMQGNPVPAKNVGCETARGAPAIDWSRARRPEFLRPYVIREVAGIRVAIIGIDHTTTPNTTTPANVSDLCFRDDYDTYVEVRRSLEGKAELFVLLMHNGDSSNETSMSDLVRRLMAEPGRMVDAVVAGHTHFVNDLRIGELVPAIQSGANGERFGRIDLVYDVRTKQVIREQTRQMGGIRLHHERCDEKAVERGFCAADPAGAPLYEGEPVTLVGEVVTRIAQARAEIAPLAERVIGVAEKRLSRDRIGESSLSNALTDAFRAVSAADIAFLNTGGLRTDIPQGQVTYERLFEVLPFANRGLVVGPMTATRILALLERSARTCGSFGALMQSGLRVTILKNCTKAVDGIDPKAQLARVETLDGEVLLDAAAGIRLGDERSFRVATLDFLAAGGSGFDGFKGVPILEDLGILREALFERFSREPVRWNGALDGRWKVERP